MRQQTELKTHITDAVTGQSLYLIIDPVHTLKNIYNNFQARKIFECPPMHSWMVFEEIRSQPDLMNKLLSADSHISFFF